MGSLKDFSSKKLQRVKVNMNEIRASCVFLLILLQVIGQINSEDRCWHHTTNYADTYPMVKTSNGFIRGIKQTQVDGRQNKTVTWTSFFVSFDCSLHEL